MRVELPSLLPLPPLSISPLPLSGCCGFKKGEFFRAPSSSPPRLRDHFFPLVGVWGNGAGGRGVCHGTDGLYFDYGAFVVMGDGRRGGAAWCVRL